MMGQSLQQVPLEKSYRLLNLGATALLTTGDGKDVDVMAAAWTCALDFDKVSIVVDKTHYSRGLIERSPYFVVQIPTKQIVTTVMHVGSVSKHENPDKLEKVRTFRLDDFEGLPLVDGCAAWILCRRLAQPQLELTHDLFLGQIVRAYADERVFEDGHWKFESASDEMRTLHYVAGGHFYTIGDPVNI